MKIALLAAVVLPVLAGCAAGGAGSTPGRTAAGELQGSVTYRERIALPPDAVLDVRLVDPARRGLAAPIVARTAIATQGRQAPLPFTLHLAPPRVERGGSYSLQAHIRSGGRVLFTSEKAVPVVGGTDPGRVELLLVRAAGSSAVPDLRRSNWLLEDLAGEGPPGRVDAMLAFDAEGRIGINGGCNRFSAAAEIDGQALVIGAPAAVTQVACLSENAEYETRYLQALQRAEWFETDGKVLRLFARDLEQPLRFSRLKN